MGGKYIYLNAFALFQFHWRNFCVCLQNLCIKLVRLLHAKSINKFPPPPPPPLPPPPPPPPPPHPQCNSHAKVLLSSMKLCVCLQNH